MKILFISPEVSPFASTGGLADVSGSLPNALSEDKDNECSVIMPLYRQIAREHFLIEPFKENISVEFNGRKEEFNLCLFKNNGVRIYFIEKNEYYDREHLYGTARGDYPDNALRFGFFAKAVTAAIKYIGKQDILHCNDWQTGLIPFYIKNLYKEDPFFKDSKILFTIHNMAYQGVFRKKFLKPLGISKEFFNFRLLEFYKKLSFMKAGIIYSDAVSTVSEGYAKEILTKEYGCGLDGLLREKQKDLYGIINGADYKYWDPAIDKNIVKNYSAENLAGKIECKKDISEEFGIEYSPDRPLIAMITRLADQKGVDIVSMVMKDIMFFGLDFILLGTGEERYQKLFIKLSKKYKGKMGVKMVFDSALAHRIEAGADIFLMPSRYEPCGLNQMYSLKYATVPIVRETGGLQDTIEDFNIATKKGNGFKFQNSNPKELKTAIKKAIGVFKNKELWDTLLSNCLSCDYSWSASAKKYKKLYLSMKNPVL